MNGLRLKKVGEDRVRISGIDWATVACLLEVPNILPEAKAGKARERLFPPVSSEAKVNDDWQQLVTPELEHLFASAGETFAKDVEPLKSSITTRPVNELTIARQHCEAWMSALNQARLILGAKHDVTEHDMDEEGFVQMSEAKQQAVLRIHILGYVVQLFVEFLSAA